MNTRLAAILARPIAHRGLHDRHLGIVENSFEAADAAIAAGFSIECDIRLSGDGEAVVFHDDDLDRLTALSGPVAARSAAELSAIPLRDGQGTIPLLSEFLARIGGRVPLVVEIKSRGDGDLRLADQALEAVAGYGGAIALKSFDPLIVERCRRHGAACPLGLIGPSPAREPSDARRGYDFLSWHVEALETLQGDGAGLPLMSWTIRSAEQHARASRHGAQIVFEHYKPR